MKKKSAPRPGEWTYSAGRRPFTVTAYERKERRNEIWIRFGSHRRKLAESVRDQAGRVSAQLEAEVIAMVADAQSVFSEGRDPSQQRSDPENPLTLRQAFDAALTLGSGLYATRTAQWRDMRTIAGDICELLALRDPNDPKGPTEPKLLKDVTGHDALVLTRAIAECVAGGRKREIANKTTTREIPWGGFRMAVRAVEFLFRVVRFMAEKQKFSAPKLAPKWREVMKEEWRDVTNKYHEVNKLAHSATDVARMFASLKDADPRLHILLELGAEARLGQVARSMRSHLSLEGGVLGFGVLTVEGRSNKRGTEIDLTESQQALILDTMRSGYLLDLERHFQAGRLQDYPLFPGKRFTEGVCVAKKLEDGTRGSVVIPPRPVTEDGLRGWFKEFEKTLAIPQVKGRGWYGVRRKTADLAEDAVVDPRALNRLTGHADTKSRRGYQSVTPRVRLLAVSAREANRNRPQIVPELVPRAKDVVQVQNSEDDNSL